MQRQTKDKCKNKRKKQVQRSQRPATSNHKKKGETIMKTLKTTIAAMMIMLTSLAASAQPMSVYAMRNNARFLTDRMAYTLGISAALLDDLYYINYDYICGVNDYLDAVALGYRYDDYMEIVYARDYALRRLLSERQWALLMTYDYFYRPIAFNNHRWSFSIYLHDRRMDHFFYAPPRRFNDYRGGTFFGGMRRVDVPGMRPGGPGPGMPPPVRSEVNPGNNVRGNAPMGDMRGEVIRGGNTPAGNERPYHFESTTPNRGNVGNGTTVVNRSGGSTVISQPNSGNNATRSVQPNVNRNAGTTVISFPNSGNNTTRSVQPNVNRNMGTTVISQPNSSNYNNSRTSAASVVNRSFGNTTTRSTATPTPRTSGSTVTSFPGSASRTSTPTTRSSVTTNMSRPTTSNMSRPSAGTSSNRTSGSSQRVSVGRR